MRGIFSYLRGFQRTEYFPMFESVVTGVGSTGEGVVLYVGMASGTVTGVDEISDEEMV